MRCDPSSESFSGCDIKLVHNIRVWVLQGTQEQSLRFENRHKTEILFKDGRDSFNDLLQQLTQFIYRCNTAADSMSGLKVMMLRPYTVRSSPLRRII